MSSINNPTKNDAFRVYLIFSFLWRFGLMLAFTVNMVYLVTVMHLDPLQMVLVGTALELSAFLFEVPTGVVADVYSRRLSVIVGVALMGLSFFIFVVPSFVVILFSQVVLGLGWTFISGAMSAWLVDEIGEEHAGQAFIRSSQASQIAGAIGIVVSIALALIDLRLPIVAAGISLLLVATYMIVAMKETGFEPAPTGERTTFQTMFHTTTEGMRTIRGKPILLTLMAAIFVWGAFSEGYDRLWTLHILENFSLPQLGDLDVVIWFGVISLLGMPIGLAVTEFVRRRVQVADQVAIARTLIRASIVLMAALVVFALAGQFWLALIAIWAIGAMRGINDPLREAWINQGLDPKVRATVISMTSQMDAFGQIAGGPGIGLIGQQFGVRIALALGAVILAPVIGLYSRTIRQHGRLMETTSLSTSVTPLES